MNPNDPHNAWLRLTAAARQVPDTRDTTPPYGFATRVVALAFSQERKAASLFERFALRAVGVAGLLAISSVAFNYSALAGTGATMAAADEEILPADDAVSLVFDPSD